MFGIIRKHYAPIKRKPRINPEYKKVKDALRHIEIEKIVEKNKRFYSNWEAFKKTNEFKLLKTIIETQATKHPYSENIMFRIYSSGFWEEPFIKD